ncbi:MAG: hypothetical protein KatS3mg082_1550 [Nitrospiraceae bacterium]|nr:MAG: hypothetical protein KatS3mg082_1550 [Nitrospiraceae bacterium]
MGLIQIGRHEKDGRLDRHHDDGRRRSGELGAEGLALAHDVRTRLLRH